MATTRPIHTSRSYKFNSFLPSFFPSFFPSFLPPFPPPPHGSAPSCPQSKNRSSVILITTFPVHQPNPTIESAYLQIYTSLNPPPPPNQQPTTNYIYFFFPTITNHDDIPVSLRIYTLVTRPGSRGISTVDRYVRWMLGVGLQ